MQVIGSFSAGWPPSMKKWVFAAAALLDFDVVRMLLGCMLCTNRALCRLLQPLYDSLLCARRMSSISAASFPPACRRGCSMSLSSSACLYSCPSSTLSPICGKKRGRDKEQLQRAFDSSVASSLKFLNVWPLSASHLCSIFLSFFLVTSLSALSNKDSRVRLTVSFIAGC